MYDLYNSTKTIRMSQERNVLAEVVEPAGLGMRHD